MNKDEVVSNVHRKIEREKALINAANAMRQSTNNPAVLSRLDAQIRDGRRNIEYFEGTLRELEMRRDMESMNIQGGGGPGPGSAGQGLPGSSQSQPRNPLTPPPKDDWNGYMGDSGGYGDSSQGGYSQISGGHGLMPPRAPYATPGPNTGQPKRPNYSRLGESSFFEDYWTFELMVLF